MLNKEKKTKELLSDIAKLEKKYEDKIAVVIVSALRKSEKTIEESDLIAIWNKAEDKIIDLIYELLERVYRLILEFIKEVYPKVKISKRIDIKSLTWQEDGKTIEDRVKLYCDYAHEVLKTDKNISKNVQLTPAACATRIKNKLATHGGITQCYGHKIAMVATMEE